MAADNIFELPMFPLGSVLFPSALLPLHIFELRYQQLLNQALETDRRFGVVLITRGHEVGGGEGRSPIGTIAHIDEVQRFDDGRAALVSTGTSRLRVVEWLDDDPYPRAMVEELAVEQVEATDQDLFDQAQSTFSDLIELGQRLGRLASMPKTDWEDDLEAATWQLASRAPCTAHDQYSILAATSRSIRLTKIDELLKGVAIDLELMGQAEQ